MQPRDLEMFNKKLDKVIKASQDICRSYEFGGCAEEHQMELEKAKQELIEYVDGYAESFYITP